MVVPLYIIYGAHSWVTRFSWKLRVKSVVAAAIAIGLASAVAGSITNGTESTTNNSQSVVEQAPASTGATADADSASNAVPNEAPGAALTRQALALYRGDYEAAWEELHPKQQAQIDQAWFIACGTNVARGAPVTSIAEVSQPFTEDVTVDGVAYTAMAVTLRYTYYNGQQRDFVRHTVADGGLWRWLMVGAGLRDSRDGICGIYFGEMA
jgi:hypothetical protein